MNIQQLEIAIAVAETGSISRAAERFFLSQPNASYILKSLESELGYDIFRRSRTGMVATEEGKAFLDHARIILYHAEHIQHLKDNLPVRLLIAATSYTPLFDAFIRLCQDLPVLQQAALSFTAADLEPSLRQIYQQSLDLGIFLLSCHATDEVRRMTKSYNLSQQTVAQIPMYVNLRRGHPLAGGPTLDLDRLRDYPYVDYVSSSLIKLVSQHAHGSQISYTTRITVNDRHLRSQIVAATDAFSIGARLPHTVRASLGLVSYPAPAEPLLLIAFYRPDSVNNPWLTRYLAYLQDILSDQT